VDITAVTNLAIWGNHSSTMYPDFFNAKIQGKPVPDVIGHREWLEKRLHQHRAAARRGDHQGARPPSAASAANAVVDTLIPA
jgi:malate dehydrogenase